MSLREHDASADPGTTPAPLTRREARELEAARARGASSSVGSTRSSVGEAHQSPAPASGYDPHPISAASDTARRRDQRPARAASRGGLEARAARAPRGRTARVLAAGGATAALRAGGTIAPRKMLSFGALLFAGALLVGMSVPANAFMTGDSGAFADINATRAPGQSVAVSADALSAAPVRDQFNAISYAEQLQQKYGNVSYAFTATTGAIRWPFPYPVPITDGFGPRAANISGSAFHNGVDFVPGGGTPIYAIADGIVTTHTEDQYGFGNHVIIQHDIPGQNVESLYAHMAYGSSPLKVGDAIKVGDFIGLVGDTGNSYGAHLHFELHVDKVPVDPFIWLTNNAVN
jgi:hypothetical protein